MKTTCKRALSLLLALTLLCSCVSMVVFAAAPTVVSLRVGQVVGAPGETVDIPVYITGAQPGQVLRGFMTNLVPGEGLTIEKVIFHTPVTKTYDEELGDYYYYYWRRFYPANSPGKNLQAMNEYADPIVIGETGEYQLLTVKAKIGPDFEGESLNLVLDYVNLIGANSTDILNVDENGKLVKDAVIYPMDSEGNILPVVSMKSFNISAEADKTSVQCGDEVTVQVAINGGDVVGADVKLSYDKAAFEYVGTDGNWYHDADKGTLHFFNVGQNGAPLPAAIGALKFKARMQNELDKGVVTFISTSVEENWVDGNTGSSEPCDNNVKAEVTITKRKDLNSEIAVASGADKEVTYNGQAHGFNPIELDGTELSEATITYTNEAGDVLTALPEYTDAGEYAVNYTVSAPGYLDYSGKLKLTINKATMDYTVTGFEGPYDGQPHGAVVEGTVPAEVTVMYGTVEGVYTLTESPTQTDVGTQTVYYKITAPNYEDKTGSFVLKVTEAAITGWAVVANETVTYDGQAHASATVTAGVPADATVTYTWAEGTASSTEIPSFTMPGTYKVNYAISKANYTTVNGSYEFTINEAKIGASAEPYNGTYDGAEHAGITVTIPEGLEGVNVTYALSENGEYTATVPMVKNAVDTTIYWKAEKAGYTTESGNVIAKVAKKGVTITVADASKKYGEADPAFTATVEDLVNEGDLGTITAVRKDEGEAVGSYKLTATYTANDNYKVTIDEGDLTIGEATIAYTAEAYGAAYDGKEHTISVTTTTEGAKITYSLTKEGNYTEEAPMFKNVCEETSVYFKIEKEGYATVTGDKSVWITAVAATIKANGASKTYGEADPESFTATVTGAVEGETLVYSVARAEGNNAGTYKIAVTKDADAAVNKNYIITTEEGEFTINKKTVKVTADGASKTYGEADPEFTATVEEGGLVGNDTLNYTVTRGAGENVGKYDINVVAGENANYTIDPVPGKFTISKKTVTVTADSLGKTYGEADPALTAAVAEDALVGNDTLNYTVTREVGEDVGEYAITVTAGENANYTIIPVDGKFTISKKTVTVTAEDKTKVYGATDPELTAKAEGVKDGDTLAYTLSRAEGENVGEHTITVTPGENKNYDITPVPGKLTITKAALTITADAVNATYGDEEKALTYTVTGLVGEDKLPEGFALTREPGTDAGTYAIKNGDVTAMTNYAVTYVGADYVIAPKAVTIVVADATKTYGDADPAFTATVEDLVNEGDLGTITAVRKDEGEAVGSYKLTATYTENKNYTVKITEGTLTISEAGYVVETTEYVSGYSLVLVHTNSNATFSYNGAAMYDVTSAGYTYGEAKTKYDHVYALVVKGDASKENVAADMTAVAKVLNCADLDVNNSNTIDLRDAVAVVAVYNTNETYMNNYMAIVLEADTDHSKNVNTFDFGAIKSYVLANG